MKKNKGVMAILLMLGLILSGCGKESFEDIPGQKSSTPTQKAKYSNMEMLGMAANLKDIIYNKGQYDISFYGVPNRYSVVVNSFQADSIIDLSISYGSNTTQSVLDIKNERIKIGGSLYSFSKLQQTRVTPATDILLRTTMGVIAHHGENPQTSITFTDNGDSGFFPEGPVAGRCFWCSTTDKIVYSEVLNLCIERTKTRFFWFFTHTSYGKDTVYCD